MTFGKSTISYVVYITSRVVRICTTRQDTEGGVKVKKTSISFTIDGKGFTLEEVLQTAAALLRLAGLDPVGYELAEIRGGGADPKRYKDDQRVHVKSGDKFVSIRERAEVA